MAKLNWALIILLIGAAIQLFVGWNANTITIIVVGAGVTIGGLTLLKITINGVNNDHKGHIILGSAILVILLMFGVSAAGVLSGAKLPTASITDTSIITPDTGSGATYSATLRLYAQDIGGTLDTTALNVYALKPGIVSDRYSFMKKIYDGTTGDILPNVMSLSSGTYSKSGYNAKIGDKVIFVGYVDSSPAAAENVSFYKEATITGITAGSTPEFMLDDSNYMSYNYPTLAFYNDSESAVTVYTEDEDVAVEKTISFSVFPTNNGETWKDGALWVEAPESNIAAIKRVVITPVDSGSSVTYGMPQEVSTSEAMFKAVPALTTSTDKMYLVGAFPQDMPRISTSQKAKYNVAVTYDHPASAVKMYFKMTQNTNALTSSGGHFDSPATNLQLNLSTTGADAWT